MKESEARYLLGGPTDTWGRTWNAEEFNNSNFRVRVANVAASKNRDFFLDWVSVKLYFDEPPKMYYLYDPLNRLIEANSNDGDYFHYSYDAVGNRLAETTSAGTTPYTYDIANRLASVDGVTYTWDNNGNLLNDGANTYTYTSNKLSSITGNNLNITFQYNGLGERVSQTVNGVTTHFTLDLNAGLSQVLADGTNTYLYGLARLAQDSPASGKEYFLTDALGSVRQLVDNDGLTLMRAYEPYGEVLDSSGTGATNYGYTGEYYDTETGLVHLRARYYSPATGRFMSRDPWDGNVHEPMSYNGWVYTYANPINFTDPSGYRRDDPPGSLKSSVYCDPLQGQDRRACERIIRGISPESRSIPDSLVPYIDYDECSFLPLRHMNSRLILPDLDHPKQYGWWYHWLLERVSGWWNGYGASHVSVKLVTALSFGIETHTGSHEFREIAKEAYARKIWDKTIGFYSAVGGRQSVHKRVNPTIYLMDGDPPWDYHLN